MKRGNIWLAVISHARPMNVPKMTKLIGVATWYIGDGDDEARLYELTGAHIVRAGGLITARNRALDDAFAAGCDCLQLSDDLRSFGVTFRDPSGVLRRRKSTLGYTASTLQRALDTTGFYLAGGAPVTRPSENYFAPEFGTHSFILGDAMLIRATDLRFDERLPLKEDYDYTAQHFQRYGGVARAGRLVPDFEHRTNFGGAVDARSSAREQEAIAILREKWGSWITRNPRSPDEIRLRLPTATTALE